MKHFLYRVLIFISAPVIVIIVLTMVFPDRLPAPKISERYSFNEKVFHFDNYEADYLCLGSSMALNNFDSFEVIDKLTTINYFNFASWGLKPVDQYNLLEVYLEKNHPLHVFLISNIMDFSPPVLSLNQEQIKLRIYYPYEVLIPFFYLNHIDFKYYYKYLKTNKLYKNSDTINQSLKFDRFGGVMLVANETPYINSQYWNDTLNFDNIDEINYEYMGKILILMELKNICFTFIQTPLREGLINENYNEKISIHNRKVREIVNKYDQLYIDGTERIWPDTMFFDYGHFNKRGAKVFTNYCLNKFKAHYGSENTKNIKSKNTSTLQETNLTN